MRTETLLTSLLLAACTFALSWWHTTPGLPSETYYELLAWGGGHVLQLTCSIAMMTVWIILLNSALGRPPVGERAATILFFAMMLPWVFSPFLTIHGTSSSASRVGFTDLMRWSIFPVVMIMLVLCTRALLRARREGRLDAASLRDPKIAGFLVSAALTLFGFALGAAIQGSNTMVPAHYHASIGGVTAAFMTFCYVVLAALGLSIETPKLERTARWQPVVFGVGQMIFAAGFAIAGAYGMSRKAYGAEQASRGLVESIGLGVMGLGGFIAMVGGVLFLVVVTVIWKRGSCVESQTAIQGPGGAWRKTWVRET